MSTSFVHQRLVVRRAQRYMATISRRRKRFLAENELDEIVLVFLLDRELYATLEPAVAGLLFCPFVARA
jgi:hypothetical protein